MEDRKQLVKKIEALNTRVAELEEEKKVISEVEESLRAANQQLKAGEQQLRAMNQQLEASEQQLRALNQQLLASEAQLKKSEEKYRIIDDASRDFIFSYDLNSRFTHANRSLCRALDLEPGDIIGKTHSELGYPEKQCREWDKMHREVQKNNCVVSAETRTPMPGSEEERIFEVVLNPVYGDDSSMIGIAGVSRDITRRKQAEENLRQSEEKWKSYVEQAPYGVFIADQDGNYVEVNPAASRITGYSEEELLKKNICDMFPPESLDKGLKHFQLLLEKGVSLDEIAFCHKSGEIRYWSVSAVKLNAERFLSFVEDITDRKKAELSLKENQEELTQIIGGSAIATLVIDEEHKVTHWNRACEELTGISLERVRGTKRQWEAFYSEKRPILADILLDEKPEEGLEKWYGGHYRRSALLQGVVEVESFFPELGEEGKWLLFSAAPIRNQEGVLLGAVEMLQDVTSSRKTGEELRRERDLLNRIVNDGPTGIVILDFQGSIIEANPRAETILGISGSHIKGRMFNAPEWTITDVEGGPFPDEDLPFSRVLKTGEAVYEVEHAISWPDGTRKILDINAAPLKGKSGEIDRVVCTVDDVTERKKVDRELEESEAKYRNLFENSSDGIYLIALEDGSFVEVNNTACEMLGFSKGELLSLSIGDVDPNYPLEDFKQFWKDRPERESLVFETTHRRKDGSLIPVEVSGIKYRIGDQVLLYGRARDLTEHKKAERQRSAQQQMLARTEKIARVGSWEWDIENDVVIWSRELFRLFGLNPDEGAPSFAEQDRIYPPEDLEKLRKAVEKCSQDGIPYRLELRAIRADGTGMECLVSGVAEERDDGEIKRLFGFCQDITERKKAEEKRESLEAQLVQARRMEAVGRLAGGVAHDYNNMLSVILGYAEMAMEEVTPDSSLYQDLEEVHKAAERSRDITRQLLGFARRQTIDPRILDANDVISGMIKMLKRLIGEDIELLWKPGENVWPVNMDPSQVDQILANLCINSRDAIDGIGKIIIETSNTSLDEIYCVEHVGFHPGDYVVISVKDDGCGMSEEALDNLFEPFYSTKGMEENSGLGLATVYGIVQQNDGVINVFSKVGEGSTFKIYLPRHRGTSFEEEAPETGQSVKGRGETILLVEDESAILKMTRMILERLGYTVIEAGSPEQALQKAGEHDAKIHLLMTDVVMPGMNGRDLANKISEIYPDIKILFMSGYTAEIIASRGVVDSGVNFLQKPFSKNNVAEKIRETLDQ